MTYPAELDFKRDHTLSASARRVYDYLSTILDFTQVRAVKSQLHAPPSGVERVAFMRALTDLGERGYLVEHARDTRGVRRFSLAWSRRTDATRTGKATQQ